MPRAEGPRDEAPGHSCDLPGAYEPQRPQHCERATAGIRIGSTSPSRSITSHLLACCANASWSSQIRAEFRKRHQPSASQCLVLRKVTERPEASQFGMARIIGMSREAIVNEAERLLTDSEAYQDMSEGENPYGDGRASERIVEAIARWHAQKTPFSMPTRNSNCRRGRNPRRRKTRRAGTCDGSRCRQGSVPVRNAAA